MGHCRCCFVQPRVFEQVILNGDEQDRAAAMASLLLDHSLRSARLQRSLVVTAPPVSLGHTPGQVSRTIFDAQGREDANATTVLRSEGQAPVADQSANEAYDGLGATYSFYWAVFGRDSIDGSGLPLLGEVHFGTNYDNAFWDGHRMMFGDGDGRLFTGFTRSTDVIGHELTHGVTQYTLNLTYFGQPGALNESISDVFGSLVKQYRLNQTADQADWLIGAGILGPALKGVALRSMKAPGTAFQGDNQPADMAHYVNTSQDNGGVHTNSGIPNHAFYLVATHLGGHAWEKAGRIWYQTMITRAVPPNADFAAFARATIHTAEVLYGANGVETRACRDAWRQVGVIH